MTGDFEVQQRPWDLSGFRGDGYDRGRSTVWQLAWLIFDSLLFQRWWFPSRARAAGLRFFGASIGHGVLIRQSVRVHWPWKLTVGDNSWIGVGTWILNLENVSIGSNTCISQATLLCTGSHDRSSATFEFDNAPIHIGANVWVGTRATILRGVDIGDGATVGACALVVRDVPAGATIYAPSGLPNTP